MSAAQSAQQNNRGPGGQYSFGTHAEPGGVELGSHTRQRDYPDLAAQSTGKMRQLITSFGYLEDARSAAASRVLSATLRQTYPDAAKAQMYIPSDGTRYVIGSIEDASGKVLADDQDVDNATFEELVNSDVCLDALSCLDTSLDPVAGHNYLDTEENQFGDRFATLRVEDSLNYIHQEKSAVNRGEQTLLQYKSVHGSNDDEPTITAQDLMTDLHRWAMANDVDLEELFARAGRHAEAEVAEGSD